LSDLEPILFRPRYAGPPQDTSASSVSEPARQIAFNRQELTAILAVYGRKVATGEWRDYAIDLNRDKAVFSIFRRSSECPLYRIEKDPKLARKQGAYSVVAAGGLIMKRGHDLLRVLEVLDKRLEVIKPRHAKRPRKTGAFRYLMVPAHHSLFMMPRMFRMWTNSVTKLP
jgi:hypothetical protein